MLNSETVVVRLDQEAMRDLILIAQTTERSRSAVMRLLIKSAASKMGFVPATEPAELSAMATADGGLATISNDATRF